MKKFIPLIILLVVLTFCSCGKSEKGAEDQSRDASPINYESGTFDDEFSGTLYAEFSDKNKNITTTFGWESGDITPERIAAGFTGWTGLKFRVSSTVDKVNMKITLKWLEDSSYVTGDMKGARENFKFANTDEMKDFMTNSLEKTIKENMGDYEVVFS